MTDNDDIDIPDDNRRSRLTRAPKQQEAQDDFASAGERIAEFWKKHPDGSILTEVESREIRTDEHLPYFVHTVRAFVRKDAEADQPAATAHATRSENDPDEVTAAFPQETAETAAVSRALRYLGILAVPKKTRAPRKPAAAA